MGENEVKKSVSASKRSLASSFDNIAAGSKAANVASYVLVGKILTYLMIGISFIFVTRTIGPSQYGIYTLAVAFAAIFGNIGYFGIGTALSKFISEYRQKGEKKEINEAISSGLFLLIVSVFVLGVLTLLLSGIASQYVFHTSAMANIIRLAGLYVIVLILFGFFYDTLLGFGKGKHIAIIVGLEAFFQAAVSIILAIEGFGAAAPLIGLVVGFAVGFVAGFYMIAKYNGFALTRPSVKFMKKILSFSTPVALSNIGNNLTSSLALIFVGYFVLSSVIGNIGITSRTGSLVGAIFDSISFALLPAFSAALADKKLRKNIGNLYGYAVYLGIVLAGPALFYIAMFSAPFSYLIFGSSYIYAPLYIAIMSIGLILGIPGTYASTLLISGNETVTAFKYTTLANVLVLLLMFILVPIFGGIAYAVLTFLLLPLLIDAFLVIKAMKLFRIKLKFDKLLRLLVADLVLCAAAYPLYLAFSGTLLLIAAAVVFVVLYPLVSALIGGIDKGDTNTIKEISKGIPLIGKILGFFMDYANLVIR